MRASPRGLILGVAVVAALSMVPATTRGVVRPAIPSDFNGDGYVDLAIGAPGEAVGGTKPNAGVVHVIRRVGVGTDHDRRPAVEPGLARRQGRGQGRPEVG